MGLLSTLLAWPIKAPVSGTFWVAGQVTKAAEAERNDKGALRAALARAEAQLLAGELSEEDYDIIETDLLTRLQALPG
jgi:hypothetical protein